MLSLHDASTTSSTPTWKRDTDETCCRMRQMIKAFPIEEAYMCRERALRSSLENKSHPENLQAPDSRKDYVTSDAKAGGLAATSSPISTCGREVGSEGAPERHHTRCTRCTAGKRGRRWCHQG